MTWACIPLSALYSLYFVTWPFPPLPASFLQSFLLHSHPTKGRCPGKPPALLTGSVNNLATAGLTLRSRERSKGPRARVAACPARSTRQAERFRWILHTFSRRNFPSSVGPTTKFSPSRQIPLPREEEQDTVNPTFHPPRLN